VKKTRKEVLGISGHVFSVLPARGWRACGYEVFFYYALSRWKVVMVMSCYVHKAA